MTTKESNKYSIMYSPYNVVISIREKLSIAELKDILSSAPDNFFVTFCDESLLCFTKKKVDNVYQSVV